MIDFIQEMPPWGQLLLCAAVIMLGAFVAIKLGVWILRSCLKKWLNMPVIYPTAKSIWKVLVYIYAISLFLQYVVHVSPSTLLAAIGISGLTIGVGLQGFVRDVVSGIVLLVSPNFSVGDKVVIKNTYSGIVHKITLLHTQLKADNGQDIFISNSEVTAVEVIGARI